MGKKLNNGVCHTHRLYICPLLPCQLGTAGDYTTQSSYCPFKANSPIHNHSKRSDSVTPTSSEWIERLPKVNQSMDLLMVWWEKMS